MIGEKIKKARKKASLTQEQLAQKSHLAPSSISEYERNIKTPSIGALEKIADALDVPMAELMGAGVNFNLSQIPTNELIEELTRRCQ